MVMPACISSAEIPQSESVTLCDSVLSSYVALNQDATLSLSVQIPNLLSGFFQLAVIAVP